MRKKQVLAVTDRVIGTTTDVMLLVLYSLIGAASAGSSSPIKISQSMDEAQKWLDSYNYDTIKHALYNLTKKKLLRRPKKYSREDIEITNLGWKRIRELVPTYKEKRPWDGHLYLISYDIPTSNNTSRNFLRQYIQKTGGAMLQDSLWINPYNPTKLIDTYVSERNIPGTVLISKIGKDGAIGDETIQELLERVYHLEHVRKRYDDFIETFAKHTASPFAGIQEYLSILACDPQLPFPLLPKNFPDRKAYELYTFLQTLPRRQAGRLAKP